MPDITVLRGQTFLHPLMETQVFIIIDIPVSVNGIQVFQFVLISIIHFKFSLISQFSTYIPRESFKLIYFPLPTLTDFTALHMHALESLKRHNNYDVKNGEKRTFFKQLINFCLISYDISGL